MQDANNEPNALRPTKLELIFLIPSFQVGGAEKVMLSLALDFRNKGYKTALWALDPTGPLRKEAIELFGKTDSEHTHNPASAVRILKNIFKIFLYVWKTKPPIAIVSSVSGTNIYACMIKAILPKKVTLVIREATTLKNYRSKWKLLLAQKFYRYADKIVAVSREVKDGLIERMHLPTEQIVVINNPVNQEKARRLANADMPITLPANKKILLYVGRMQFAKGPDILLEAFARCEKRNEAQLVMVGDGAELPNLKEMAERLRIADQVNFVGHMENPFPFFRRAQIFVLPSRWEGFVNVLLEAMAIGVPNIISSDCRGGPADILRHGEYGTLVPPEDINALTKALNETLGNLRNATNYDISDFEPATIFSTYEKLIMDCLPVTQ